MESTIAATGRTRGIAKSGSLSLAGDALVARYLTVFSTVETTVINVYT